MEYQQTSDFIVECEASNMNCVVSKEDDHLLRTQHTAVSTLGASFHESTLEFEGDDDCSIASGEIFDCNPLDVLGESEYHTDLTGIDTALRIIGDDNDIPQEDYDDDVSELHDSCGSFNLFDSTEANESTNSGFHESTNSLENSGFQDSMTSLNDAFEKLYQCMDRTAQSRKLVREFAAQCPFEDADLEALQDEETQKDVVVVEGMRMVQRSRSWNKGLNGSSCHGSVGSRSSARGSRGSRSSATRGRRTYSKSKPRRAGRKSELTGVAPRASLLALLSNPNFQE